MVLLYPTISGGSVPFAWLKNKSPPTWYCYSQAISLTLSLVRLSQAIGLPLL